MLVAVALLQLWLVRHEHLSAWCGGGFGMFSTIDGFGARRLHAVALSPAVRAPLEIPPELREEADRALALPTERRLRALALALAERAPSDFEPPEAIEIAVFARRHDPETLAPRGELLRAVRVPLDGAESKR
jgi:hypothetical protein